MQRKGKTSFTKAKSKLLCYLLSGALLFGNLMAFQTVPASAAEVTESNNENQETLQPKVIVSSYDELVQAIDEAGDEDIIGIDSVIQIEDDNIVLGNNIKRITIIRSARKSGIEISGKNPVINNIVFDGNRIEYKDIFYPMLDAKNGGKFTDLEIRNCHNNIWGAALKITGGTVVVSDCNFHDNVGSESAHIGVMGAEDISIYRSIFKNGHVENCAGAIGVYSKGMSALIKDCIITGNHADRYAGGIVNWGNLTISNTVIYGNTALCGADIMNYPDSEFHMDLLEQIKETYESVSIIPKEWTADYDDEVLQGVNPSGIYDKNAYLKLIYEEIPKEESDLENSGLGKDESKGDNTEPEQSKDDSDKENDNKDDSADNKDNVGNKKDENGTSGDTIPDNGNKDDADSEQNKSEGGTAADSDSNKENDGTEDKENQEDKQENQGNQDSLGNNENKDSSSSDSDKKDIEDSNNNTSDTSAGNGNQTSNSSIEKPNTGNNGSSSGSTTPSSEGNKQPDSVINNENQGGSSAGDMGNNSDNNNQNQTNTPVSGVANNTTNGNASGNTNSGSDSSTGNSNINTGVSQNGGNESSKPENNQDNNSGSSDNGGTVAITGDSQTSASDTNKDDSENKNVVKRKKAIKKLTVTAKRGKGKISGKTLKKATIKIKIGKKTYKVKSNAKGKFTVKLKGKAKLKKGQKVKVIVSKKGYKTKSKIFKVK